VRPTPASRAGVSPQTSWRDLAFTAALWNAGRRHWPSRLPRAGTDVMDSYQYFYKPSGKVRGYVKTGTLDWDARPGHQHGTSPTSRATGCGLPRQNEAVRTRRDGFCLVTRDASRSSTALQPGPVNTDPIRRVRASRCPLASAFAAGYGGYVRAKPTRPSMTSLTSQRRLLHPGIGNPDARTARTTIQDNKKRASKGHPCWHAPKRTLTVPPYPLVTSGAIRSDPAEQRRPVAARGRPVSDFVRC